MKKLIAIFLSVFLLAGCGSSGDDTQTTTDTTTDTATEEVASEEPTEEPAEDVTLRTASMFGGTDPSAADYQNLISQFEDSTGVTVTDESATADEQWKQRILGDFSVGNDPDVLFYFTGVDGQALIDQDKVVPVSEIQAEYPDYAANIKGSAMDSVRATDGEVYAVPIRGFWEGLFVNKDMFEQYGLELPTSWDNLLTAITTFKENDVVPVAVSFADVPHYWIEHLILATAGVDGHKEDLKPDNIPDTWVEGLDLFKTLNDMGAFPVDVAATTNDAISTMFKNKQAAMIVDGSWFLGGIEDTENTTVVPFPAYTDAKDPSDIIAGFSSGFYITRKAWDDPAKKDAAVEFVMNMTSNDAIGAFATAAAGAAAAEVSASGDVTPLSESGIELGSNAKGSDMPIDSRLSKEAWNEIVSNISAIADGTVQSIDILTEAANLNQ